MQSYKYPNCDYCYKDSFLSGHPPDYWATQRFEIPSDEFDSYYAPDGSYSAPRHSPNSITNYESWLGECDRGRPVAEQMAMGSLINYLSSSADESECDEDDLFAALNSYYKKGIPAGGDEFDKIPFSHLHSTNRKDLSAAEVLLEQLDREMEEEDEVDVFEEAAVYSLHENSDRDQYLFDGQNLIKIRTKKYSKIIRRNGWSVIKILTRKFITKTPIPESSRESFDFTAEESNWSENFGDFECYI